MDLRTLKQRLNSVNIDGARLQQPNPQSVSNFLAFKTAVDQLADIPALTPLIQQIRAHPLYSQTTDMFSTDPQTIAQIIGLYNALRSAVTTISSFIDQYYKAA